MQGKLPQIYKVSRELDRKAFYEGEINLSQMPRLASLVLSDEANIKVSFEFEANTFKQAVIKGNYSTELTVECQRCLDSMVESIEQNFKLLIDASEEDIQSFQMDSVFSEEGYLDVFEVIEDELILALPIILMHEDTQCNKYMQTEFKEQPAAAKENPFSVLKALKETD